MNKSRLVGGAVIALLLHGCGVKGPLQPPLLLIPSKVQQAKVSQVGAKIVLAWETPLVYESGVAMSSLPVVEVWALEIPFSSEAEKPAFPGWNEFRRQSKLVAEIKEKDALNTSSFPSSLPSTWDYSFDHNKLARVVFFFSLRLRDEKGRKSEFSDPLSIIPVNVSPPPQGLEAELLEDKIMLHWRPGQGSLIPGEEVISEAYHVYRREGDSAWVRLNISPVQATEWEDSEVSLNKVYQYKVRAVKLDDPLLRESEDSAVCQIAMRDIFPPSPPSGLTFVFSGVAVALSWDPVDALDLAGYRVWRREEKENDFRLLTPEPILATSFEDREVEKGKSYHYAISACDRAGNESRRTEIATGVLR